MNYCSDFFRLQWQFAERVTELSGITLTQALLDYTNLYIRFGLGRGFDPEHPIWREYLAGLRGSGDDGDWTYRFFLTGPPSVQPPSVVAKFGCFSYAKLQDDRIRIHFQNAETGGRSPFCPTRSAARLDELRALFKHVRRSEPGSPRVVGLSWLYNLACYRRLFPEAYLATARPAMSRFRHVPLWGQFLDRHGDIRQNVAVLFRERLSAQTGMGGIARCFPLQPLALQGSAADFYRFYGIRD